MAFFSHDFLKQYRKSSKDSATIFSKFSLFGETIFWVILHTTVCKTIYAAGICAVNPDELQTPSVTE